MLAVLFVLANPAFGVKARSWPWDMFVHSHTSMLIRTLTIVWIVTGSWCLLLAFTQSIALRAVGAAVLGAPLLIEATGGVAGLTINDYNLNKMVPMILLGGGLLLAAEPATRGPGRLLAGSGGLLLIWALASGFADADSPAQLALFLEDLGLALRDPAHDFPDQPNHLWWDLVPQALVILASVGGILALVGLSNRLSAQVIFWVLFTGLAAPGLVGSTLTVVEGGGLNSVLTEISRTMIGHGFLLWMLGVYVIADLGKLSSTHGPSLAEGVA
jgi:hypothetical protein